MKDSLTRQSLAILTAAVVLALFAGLVLGALLPGGEAPRPLTRVTIIDVVERPAWSMPRTLIEREDGTRALLHGYYGEQGDTFTMRQDR